MTPAKMTAGLCLAAGMFFAGYMANRQPAPTASAASTRQVLYYTCPMHPQYRSDHPGEAPCCGMRMVPVYAGSTGVSASAEPPGLVQVSAARQQLIGVRTDEVRRAPISQRLRVSGRVTVDDERLYRLIAATDGWMVALGRNASGAFVKKGELLGSYYTANLFGAAQTFVFAGQTNAQISGGEAKLGYQRTPTVLNLQVALDSLRALGMAEKQIEEIRRTRTAPADIKIYSPIDGFVLARSISPDQQFAKGVEMYRIADIGHVWVLADIYERDRDFVKPGDRAEVIYRGRRLEARMSDSLPQFDPQTRTLKTRFELDNPGYVLRPDMFVDIEIGRELPASVTVPADAVIDSGLRQTVYVDRGSGFFEPRLVSTGWRTDDRVEITSGLAPGERIVVAGNFLIDSESRMRLAAARAETAPAPGKAIAAKDPVCGMEVDPNDPEAIKTDYRGKTYYFCSTHCKKSFEANPEKYLSKKSLADSGGGRNPA